MPKTLMELTSRSCRYIVAEEPFLYCDGNAKRGSPFCREHHAICYVPGTKRAHLPIHLPVAPLKPEDLVPEEPDAELHLDATEAMAL